MASFFSTFTGVGLVNTSNNAGTIQLPRSTEVPFRQVTLKDINGTFSNRPLTLTTQAPDTFEDGLSSKVFRDNFSFLTFYAGGNNKWYILNGTTTAQQTISSLTVSTIFGNGSGLTNLNAISSPSLLSTVAGLGTAGYVSSASLLNLVSTANLLGLVSTPNLLNLVSTPNLLNLVSSANLLNLVSTPNLLNLVSTTFLNTSLASTTQGLGSAGYISSVNLAGLVSTPFLNTSLASTTQGLATIGYISSTQLQSTFVSYANFFTSLSTSFSSIGANNISSAQGFVSSLIVNSLQFGAGTGWVNIGPIQAVALSTIQLNTNALYANNSYFGTASSLTALQFFGLYGSYSNTVIAEQSTGAGTQELLLYKVSSTSDQVRVQTTGTFRVETGVSARAWPNNLSNATPALIIDINSNVGIQTNTPATALDVAGTGRFQLVSTLGLNLSSINADGIVTRTNLTSSVAGLATVGYLSTSQLTSTVAGLGSAGYVSSANLLNLVSTPFLNTSLASTVAGLGTAGYVSSANLLNLVSSPFLNTSLASTVAGLGTAGYISSPQLISTVAGLQTYISSFIDPNELASSILNLVSTTFVNTTLASTVAGLGTAGYVSTANLLNLVSTTFLNTSLASTTAGLGTAGYVSSANLLNLVSTGFLNTSLASTTTGLGSAGYVSTASLLNLVSTSFLNTSLASTTAALGTAGYVSSANLLNLVSTGFLNTSLASTVAGLGTAGYISSTQLTSTVTGLGTIGYISSTQFASTTTAYSRFFTTLSASISSLGLNNLSAGVATISSLQVNGLQIGTGTGWVNIGPIQTVALSAIQVNTSLLYASNGYFGLQSSLTALQFFGLYGSYSNTVIAEQSTGAGVQELLLYKVSSTSDQVRVQTTGTFRVETGVSARSWPNNLSNATPALLIDINSNVGIQTNTPATTLDVAGTGRFQLISSLGLNVSSINGDGLVTRTNLTSSIVGLASVGYISTTQLTSTIRGLGTLGYLSSTNFGYVSTGATQGSTFNLIDPYNNNMNYLTVSSGILLLNGTAISGGGGGGAGVSQIIAGSGISLSPPAGTGIVTVSAISPTQADLVSTVQGLGSSGYASTSYVTGQISSFSTALGSVGSGNLTTVNLASTVTGLGSSGYVSTLSLVSTTVAFQTAGFLSSANLTNIVSTAFLNTTLASTVAGLGSANYVSTASLTSTVAGVTLGYQTAGFLSSPNLLSTVGGLGSANYVSTASLTSTVAGVTTGYQTAGFLSSPNLVSTVGGLGSASYVSTASLTSTVAGVTTGYATAGFLSSPNLLSTVGGLGTIGYASTTYVTGQISSFSTALGAVGGGGLASIPANLSTFAFFTSSITASTIFTTILSTQQLFTSSIFGNTSQFQALSSQSLFVSSFYTATRQMTPMFVTF